MEIIVKENLNVTDILRTINNIKIDHSWSFVEYKPSDTSKWTHGYHRYPAKFIPQLVERLFDEYVPKRGDIVVNDPFMGCGTTIVSAIARGYYAFGTDINHVAYKITKVKATPITPNYLKGKISCFINNISFLRSKSPVISLKMLYNHPIPVATVPKGHIERIDYWFREKEKKKLSQILTIINEEEDETIRLFFQVAFSHVLKNCSLWLQKSTKPTRDMEKIPADPYIMIVRQLKKMERGNKLFYLVVSKRVKENINDYLNVETGDAKKQPTGSESVDIVITSSPYVTSYEYADLHQLSTLWLDLVDDLKEYRKKFIGSGHRKNRSDVLNSSVANGIIDEMKKRNGKMAREIKTFFIDMEKVIAESYRILKHGGEACYVIGNTTLKGVNILNAEAFLEIMEEKGFSFNKIIKREIPSKILPQSRDLKTGRFVNPKFSSSLAYPCEYIIVVSK